MQVMDNRKRGGKQKPRGRVGKMWDKVKGSRVGKAAGRIGGRIGGNAVRGIAGTAGRLAGSVGLSSIASMLGVDLAAIAGPPWGRQF